MIDSKSCADPRAAGRSEHDGGCLKRRRYETLSRTRTSDECLIRMATRITHRDLMIASSTAAPFSRAGWLFEAKYDGFRIMPRKEGSAVRLITRNGIDLAGAFPELIGELRELPDVVMDGELVVLDEQGKPQFESLRRRARMTRPPAEEPTFER